MPENPFAASASAKQKPFHCTAKIARKLNDKNASVDYRAVPPPDNEAGGDYKREDPCQQDSQRSSTTASGASSSGRLEPTGVTSSARRPGTMRDPLNTGEREGFPPTNTGGEQHIRRFDDPARCFQVRNHQQRKFHTMVLHSICAKLDKDTQTFVVFCS